MALADLARPLREGGELLLEERPVVLVGGGEVRHRAGEPQARGGGDGGRDARGLRGVARAEPAHPRVELDVHAGPGAPARRAPRRSPPARRRRRRARRARSSAPRGDSAPITSSGPSMPAARSSAASSAVATASHAAPPACAARAARHRAVPVAVGLHHRAQPRGSGGGGQAGAVALDRGQVHPGERPHGHRSLVRRVEHVDAGDHADQAPVLDHRQPVVLRARDQLRRLLDASRPPRSSPGPGSSCAPRWRRTPCARAPRSATSTRGTRRRRTAGSSAAGAGRRPPRRSRGRPR